MRIGIRHSTPEKHHGMIEKRSVTIGNGLQFHEKTRKMFHLILLENKEPVDFLLQLAVMGEAVISFLDIKIA